MNLSIAAANFSVAASAPESDAATAYLSGKCHVVAAPEKGGHEVLAIAPIAAGELIAMWSGRLVAGAQLPDVPEELVHRVVQVEEDLFLVSVAPMEGADMLNHCCAPNAGLSGQIGIVAMRDIAPGEEVTIDYAMCDGCHYDEFQCACGVPECRGRVTGDDWRLPALQQRYAGYFSPYLARRIARQSTLTAIVPPEKGHLTLL